jgi:hypothetical protein
MIEPKPVVLGRAPTKEDSRVGSKSQRAGESLRN